MMSCKPSPRFLSTAFVWFALFVTLSKRASSDPTDGFTAVPLNEGNFKLQKPTNSDPNKRYSFKDGIRKLWVYSNDEPFQKGSDTAPRTEIRMFGHDYSKGVWQFEAYAYIPKGTTGVSIMQVFNSVINKPSLMLRVYDGQLKYINTHVIEDNISGKWFRLNVIHTVAKKNISVFIDGNWKYDYHDDLGGGGFYFKFGVYTQDGSSDCMESRWKDVHIYKK